MRRVPWTGRVAALGAAVACALPLTAGGAPIPATTVDEAAPTSAGQSSEIYLVELDGSAETFRKEAKGVGLKYTERFAYKRLFKGVAVKVNGSDVGKLAGIGSVANVYPARLYTVGPVTFADPDLATAIKMTGADLAQAAGHTGAGVKVAVMDTGIDVDHQDLGGDGNQAAPHPFPNSRIVAGLDLVGDDYNADPESANYQPVPHPDANPDDCNGHGTHVAGIVGANGAAKGIAPGVTFGAYRVFGCAGSVTDDVMIAAMEAALEDGMHVLNMSIGDAFNNWPGSPTAAASDALVDAGMVVVASIGNSGADGIYSAGAPGVGDKVIGVASYDNTHVRQIVFKVSPDGLGIPFGVAAASPPAPTSGTMTLARTGTTTTEGDGCINAPAPGSMTGKAVLIRRGSPPGGPTCGFYNKAINAQNAGAAAVVLYNNVPGALSPTVAGTPPVTIPVVAISAADGAILDGRIAAGPTTLTWTTEQGTFPNPTGGLISSFSSYGTAATLALKPDLGAPGGLIRSTYPLEAGGYATISGTSMASPHVAGAAALLRAARPTLAASAFRDILQNSADPKAWSGSPSLGFLDIVHRQGAGMVDIDDALASKTTISPGKLSLGEGTGGTATLTLSNSGTSAVTYDLSDTVAISTGAQTFAPLVSDFWIPETTVAFSAPSVTVPAGGTATVGVTITADPAAPTATGGFPNQGLYGGYLVFTDHANAASVYRVPYVGLKGDYQAIVAMPNAPTIGKRNAPFEKGPQTYVAAAANEVWTLASPDEVPNVLIHFDHQVRTLELQIVDAASGKPLHPVFSNFVERNFVARNATRPPAAGPFAADENVFAFPWDGTRMHDNGKGTADHRKLVPDGQYKIVARALKALGDPANPADWEVKTSSTITIDR
ncbi:MAG TPA: S8 family serine peptidase, partial [Ilumatobacteraceae bacterium]|nr:S8 family serine peptidase [Ilumatobacteraceae bacterium]